MVSSRTGRALAILSTLCVLTILFFPETQGPYPVVHGPVTALLSARAADGVRMAIVRAGLDAMSTFPSGARLRLAPLSLPGTAVSSAEFPAADLPPGCDLILRC